MTPPLNTDAVRASLNELRERPGSELRDNLLLSIRTSLEQLPDDVLEMIAGWDEYRENIKTRDPLPGEETTQRPHIPDLEDLPQRARVLVTRRENLAGLQVGGIVAMVGLLAGLWYGVANWWAELLALLRVCGVLVRFSLGW